MNSRKQAFDDVLDPFHLANGLFHLELSMGRIYANPRLDARAARLVEETIERLDLDDAICRKWRVESFQNYLEGHIDSQFLRDKYLFVWCEANRQGLV